ncbi:hypothetical protein [Burkholderia anthina]|uniref:hypothetical protein n=1 Tax=Burkholderia anthina TaxID=179879 RepID=UPI000A8CD474|nr:hypothetical protein [Burkholderia anthina]
MLGSGNGVRVGLEKQALSREKIEYGTPLRRKYRVTMRNIAKHPRRGRIWITPDTDSNVPAKSGDARRARPITNRPGFCASIPAKKHFA